MDETSGNLELEEAVDDFMAMYVAGSATTNAALLWSLGELTRHTDVMDKLVDEVLMFFKGWRGLSRFCSAAERPM